MSRESGAAPSAAALLGLGADGWAHLLPHLRAGLATVDDPRATELRTAPVSRLVGGRLRAELAALVADGTVSWPEVVDRLVAGGEVPGELTHLLDASSQAARPPEPAPRSETPDLEGARVDQVRERLRAVREERDAWQRRAAGAEAREAALRAELARARAEADELRRDRERLVGELSRAAEERERAVAREGRRQQAARARLEEELATVRRAEEDRRVAERRAADATRERAAAAAREAAQARSRAREQGAIKLVPGRPSRLPSTVRPETTEAARLLLHRGRLVLLDGYNVTLQHRGALDLELQRGWLVQVAATLVARRGIEPVIIFDGERSGGTRGGAAREVEVRFTPLGITADDEIVLAVEATDRPVVVVTDDRELAARVRAAGGDVVPTRAFLGVAGVSATGGS